ncbi:MAG: ABC transporter substrate-binding protein [Firmicutes bacterium]|nr:ABC transporter substrate-binding protein [Bacillota bacterium]
MRMNGIRHLTKMLKVSGICLVLLILVSCMGQHVTGTSQRSLVVRTALMEPEAMVYARAFENRTGIKVEVVRQSTGVMLSFLKFERNNAFDTTIDVLFGGPADAYVIGAREGLFEKYISPERANIARDHMDKDGRWSGVYLGSIGFAVNPKRLKALGVSTPTCWEDLLSPELRGEISMANPVSSGTGYTILATLAQMMGKDQALQYLKALDSNILDYTGSGAMPGKLVGLGQIAVGILFSHDVLAFRQQGYNIDLVFPKEGTGFEIGGIAIVKGTKKLDEAKKFVDFMLSAEGQNLYAAMGEFRLPTNRLAAIPLGAVPFSKINVIEYDVTWAAVHKDDLLEEWISATGDSGGG